MISRSIKRFIIISLVALFVLSGTSFESYLAFSQTLSNPLRGDKVYEDLSEKGLTPQKAFNGIKSFNDLLDSGTMFGNEPNILYTVAKYKIYLGYKHKDIDYVKKHSGQYTYFEQGDFYIYNGDDLNKIVKDYPESANADDAAFMLATMPKKLECEGDQACYIRDSLERLTPFLNHFPDSPYIYNAIVEDINKTLDPFVNEGAKSRISSMSEDQKHEIISLLNNYYNVLSSARSEDKVYGLFQIAVVFENLGLKTRAGDIYKVIIEKYIDFPRYNLVKQKYSELNQ